MANLWVAYDDNPAHYRAEVLQSLERAAQQSAVIGQVQIAALRSINQTMDSLVSEMASVQQTAAQGLALHRQMVEQDRIQAALEEFIYKFQKMVTEFEKPKTDYPPEMQYYELDCMLKQIETSGISTAIIRGRDNKAAFDDSVGKASTLLRQLAKHPDVQKALAWADGERKKRLALHQQRAGEEQKRQQQIESIQRQIEQLQASRKKLTLMEWFKLKFGTHPVPLQIGMWVLYGFIWIPLYYKFSVASDEAALNATVDAQVEQLQQRLTSLQTAR